MIEDLPLSCWGRDWKVRFSLDLPDLSNNACTLVQQGHDLLIGLVDLLSAGCKSSFAVWDLLAVASSRTAQQERYAGTATQYCIQSRCHHGFRIDASGTRVLCMKTIFQLPACFCKKADSNHCWFTVPEASVILPRLM
jgi:hypothetical protein